MNYLKNSLLPLSILLIIAALAFVLTLQSMGRSMSYTDLITAFETTTATFGTLLGIITAGLMFTQAKFSELTSELNEKAPDYVGKVLSLEKMQSVVDNLLTLRKTFSQLRASAKIVEEKNLYEDIIAKASAMFVDLAVLSNLKLEQQGLPNTSLLVSEMDSELFKAYQKRKRSVKNEWQTLNLIHQVIDLWEASPALFLEKSGRKTTLQLDLRNSLSILKLKKNLDRRLVEIHGEVARTLSSLSDEIDDISRRLHEDRIPQFLIQMKQASTLRGKYFHLTLIFIAAPLLINLLILPQLSETTAPVYQSIISATSLLSVIGVLFLILYIYKILNV
jgi:hypothetical protein